jgi:putative membrane protein
VTDTPPQDLRPNYTRDHLANERTYLAWIRTSLALIGLGFVLARMGLFLRQLAIAGTLGTTPTIRGGGEFLVSGVVFLIFGTILGGWSGKRFYDVSAGIDSGRFTPALRPVKVLTALVVVGGVIIVALVIWRTLNLGI